MAEQTKKPKILMTGAHGFIGANILRRLVAKKSDVAIVIRKSSDLWRIADLAASITFHTVDLEKKTDVDSLVSNLKPDAIIHLAAYGNSSAHTDTEKIVRTNIDSTANLMLACLSLPKCLFINTGSSSEYGRSGKAMKITDQLKPETVYAGTKAGMTLLGQTLSHTLKKPIITIRPFSVYGPYEEPNRFVPAIISSVLNAKPVHLTKGEFRHDFLYVDDLVDLYLAVLRKGAKLPYGTVLNAGTGTEYSNREVVERLFAVTKKSVPVKTGTYTARSFDTPHWKADISETEKLLGWKPQTTLTEGLRRTVAFIASHGETY